MAFTVDDPLYVGEGARLGPAPLSAPPPTSHLVAPRVSQDQQLAILLQRLQNLEARVAALERAVAAPSWWVREWRRCRYWGGTLRRRLAAAGRALWRG